VCLRSLRCFLSKVAEILIIVVKSTFWPCSVSSLECCWSLGADCCMLECMLKHGWTADMFACAAVVCAA
jgi:hypothetical protein